MGENAHRDAGERPGRQRLHERDRLFAHEIDTAARAGLFTSLPAVVVIDEPQMRTSYAFTVGALMTIGLTSVARTVSAQPVDSFTLRLYLHNHAQIPRPIVSRAEEEVSRVYKQVGVTTVWVDGHAALHPAGRDLELMVIINSQAGDQRPFAGDVMGRAPGSPLEQGRIAFAFYDPVERFARTYRVDVAVV